MKASKGGIVHASVNTTNGGAVSEKYGTPHDEMDMNRMGKLQQLRVRDCNFIDNSL